MQRWVIRVFVVMVQQNHAELGADYTNGHSYNIAVVGFHHDSEEGALENKLFF